MPAKAKYSAAYKAKKARIKKLPQIGKLVISGMRKKDALELVKIFHDGIKKNKLGLQKLEKITIENKKARGYKQPRTPLYGLGDESEKKSFVNMLRIKKLKNGWKVVPSRGKHHEANMELRQLLKIHEMGATIQRGETLIRIPARPAWRLSVEKFLRGLRKEQEDKKLKKAITIYINKGRDEYFKEYIDIHFNKFNDLKE
jgi:CxxC motif-containing protein